MRWDAAAETKPHAHILFCHRGRKVLPSAFTEQQTTARKLRVSEKQSDVLKRSNIPAEGNVERIKSVRSSMTPGFKTMSEHANVPPTQKHLLGSGCHDNTDCRHEEGCRT